MYLFEPIRSTADILICILMAMGLSIPSGHTHSLTHLLTLTYLLTLIHTDARSHTIERQTSPLFLAIVMDCVESFN